MNCEICGTEIKGQPYKTKIDNSIMITCKECSKYGKIQQKPQPKNHTRKNNKKTNNKTQNNRLRNKSYSRQSRDEEYELVDNYTKIIKQAREKQQLTQKKLGEKIYERESVIAHIESGKMIPDAKLAHKIEKILNIKIIEKMDSDEREYHDIKRFGEATIGDIARIKRSK